MNTHKGDHELDPSIVVSVRIDLNPTAFAA